MSRISTWVPIGCAAVALALSGCGSSSALPPASGVPSSSAGGATSATDGATQTTSTTLTAGQHCALIDAATARSLMGVSATASSPSAVVGGGEFTKIDGCAYIGGSVNLGYDVNKVGAGMNAALFADQARGMSSKAPGAVQFPVSAGGGFTMPVAGKFMARIEASKGDYLIAVNSVASTAAQAQQVSSAALTALQGKIN